MDVKLIQDTAVQAQKANRLDGTERAVILSDGQKVESLEKISVTRFRYRGQYTTNVLADFETFSRKTCGEGAAQVFVSIDDMSAKAFFNLGTLADPGHGDHTATLKLKPTAAFSALNAIHGQKLTQKQLAEWLEDWNLNVAPSYASGDDKTLQRAITAIRKITIKSKAQSTSQTGNFAASRSAMEEIEAQSGNDLPDGFTFYCEPYLGLAARTFKLSLSVLTGDDDPKLSVRWAQREAEIESIGVEFKNVLAKDLDGTSIALTIGSFAP